MRRFLSAALALVLAFSLSPARPGLGSRRSSTPPLTSTWTLPRPG